MPERAVRRFTLIDAAVLIAVVAVYLAGERESGRVFWLYLIRIRAIRDFSHWLEFCLIAFAPFAVSLGFALLVLRLKRPRPPLRRLIRNPGVAGLFAAAVAVGLCVLGEYVKVLETLARTAPPRGWTIASVQLLAPYFVASITGNYFTQLPMVGCAVAIVWFVVLPGRGWPKGQDWIETAGRFVSAYWIALLIFFFSLKIFKILYP